MPGRLTTHVLDTARGRPAANLRIDLSRHDTGGWLHLGSFTTNEDGRVPQPLLADVAFRLGDYELLFHAGEYLASLSPTSQAVETHGSEAQQDRFLHEVPVRFRLSQHEHYHVPLLLSPFGYSTYRGS